jgi:hypothetical protein
VIAAGSLLVSEHFGESRACSNAPEKMSNL